MTKRIVSIVFTLCMVLMLVPQAVFADEGTGSTTSEPAYATYATKEELMDTTFTPDLTTGETNKYGKIIFGKNESGAPQEWYVLGKDSAVTEGNNNTIIFAASPIATNQYFDDSDNTNYAKKYNEGDGTYPSGVPNPGSVFRNHYGASQLRKTLQDMVKAGDTTYFSKTEKELMNSTTVTTKDEKNNNNKESYTTTDQLYALEKGDAINGSECKIIKAGTDNQTALNLEYYWEESSGKENFWLRTGSEYQTQASCTYWTSDGRKCATENVTRLYNVRPASNLNLSSVLFASGATAASSEIVSKTIAPGTAMILRWDGTNKKIGTVIYNTDPTNGTIAACKDAAATGTVSLVVQSKDENNPWYYSVPVEGTIVVTAEQIIEAISLDQAPNFGTGCEIWLETTIDNVAYAKEAEPQTFSVQEVKSVAVTGMNAPVVGTAFDTEASCNTTDNTPGIATPTPAITYSIAGENGEVTGNADWNTTYKATVTLATYLAENDANNEANNEVNYVVYVFGAAVSVTLDGVTLTDEISPNPDGTLTVTKEFVTPKRKIISVTAPTVPKTFTTYYDNSDVLSNGGNRELGKQATVTLEGTENVASITEKMNVTWMIANANGAPYDKTPGAVNTFRWIIPASAFSNYDAAGCANYDSGTGTITGKVTITNKAAAAEHEDVNQNQDSSTSEAVTTDKSEPPYVAAAPVKGTVLSDTRSKAQYTVTEVGSNGAEVCYTKSTAKNATSITIPATVTINGVTYKVTSIADKAFANNKKLKKVVIGSNIVSIGKKAFYKCTSLTKITIPSSVKKIGKQAFYGCKKLKSMIIKTKKLTNKNVGSKAFKGINSKATIKVPKKKLTAYKKLLKKKGLSSKVKITVV